MRQAVVHSFGIIISIIICTLVNRRFNSIPLQGLVVFHFILHEYSIVSKLAVYKLTRRS